MRSRTTLIAVCIGSILLFGACLRGFALDRSDVRLISYHHSATVGVDEIHLDDDRLGVILKRFEEPASDISAISIEGDIVPTVNGKARIDFVSPEHNVTREVTYVGFLVPEWCQGLLDVLPEFMCAARGYIELIRQPPALLSQWGMKRDTGYVILGRTSLETPVTVVNDAPTDVRVETLPSSGMTFRLPAPIDSALRGAPTEIREAARLTSWLYSQAVRSGPAPRPYDQFLKLPLHQRVASVQAGDDAVMCAGFRDLWLAAAASSPMMGPVRHVGGYAFSPGLGDIISFSHAVAEFWVESLQKWVLIDPWFGFSLKREGEYLGVSDLADARGKVGGIEVVPLVPMIKRFSLNQDRQDFWEHFTTTVVQVAPKLDEPTFSNIYQPGYLQYFRSIEFGRAIGSYGEPIYEGTSLGSQVRPRPSAESR
jgi:hypothetical protein